MTHRSVLKLAAVVSSCILLISSLLALSYIAYVPGEIMIIRTVYALGDWLLVPMLVITQAGSPWFVFGLVIALILLHYYRSGLRLLVAAGATYVVVTLMKLAIMRPRPFLEVSDIISRELSISGNGFPSGHSAIAACIAVSVWYIVSSKYRWWLVVGLVLVGVSRIYLGVHSPLDVIGGVSVGILIACLMQLKPAILKGMKTR